MTKEIYAVCPRCGKRARIVSYRWDWDAYESFAQVKCVCGKSEIPYDDDRVLDIDLNNPYMAETHYKLLFPRGWDTDRFDLWSRISECLTAN